MLAEQPRVIILGGGFAGINAARALAAAPVEILLIDRTNHHLFQPLLYQVATTVLSPNDICTPIRNLFRAQKNISVVLAEVASIDPRQKKVFLAEQEAPLSYDYLLLACGARHSYFGHNHWEPHAPGLKTLPDALSIRRKFLQAFEEAERLQINFREQVRVKTLPLEEFAAERQRVAKEIEALLTFTIIGGGPTGCELAGILPETAKRAVGPDFRFIDLHDIKVILVEGGPRVLTSFPEKLARQACRDLKNLGVEIRTGNSVTDITQDAVTLSSGEIIKTRSVFWAAGNVGSPLAARLGVPLDPMGRVLVLPDLSVPDHAEVFVAGDLAHVATKEGRLVPGVAQAAIQGGKCVARNIMHLIRRELTEPFVYHDKGNLAVIGRRKAIADFGFLRLTGRPAFVIWIFVHIFFLIGFRNRLSVLLQWAYAYITYQRGARILLANSSLISKMRASGNREAPLHQNREGE